MATPRVHTAEDTTTLVETPDGLIACTHLWWSEQGPTQDPLAEDQAALERSRARLLELKSSLVVIGHGAPFRPNPAHLLIPTALGHRPWFTHLRFGHADERM